MARESGQYRPLCLTDSLRSVTLPLGLLLQLDPGRLCLSSLGRVSRRAECLEEDSSGVLCAVADCVLQCQGARGRKHPEAREANAAPIKRVVGKRLSLEILVMC